jgi:hypothetical protein
MQGGVRRLDVPDDLFGPQLGVDALGEQIRDVLRASVDQWLRDRHTIRRATGATRMRVRR